MIPMSCSLIQAKRDYLKKTMENNHQPALCKILTVDDQMGIDSFFYEFFSVRNYKVFNAQSGKEAIEIVKKERPRIVLLDINMRGMDGIETLKNGSVLTKWKSRSRRCWR